MQPQQIKQEITTLANAHHAIDMPGIDELKEAEEIEAKALKMITAYCEARGYLVNGFPTEKRTLFESQENVDGEDEDAYFCAERFHLYLDTLALEKDDVADLWWFFNESFWPETYDSKEAFLEGIRDQVENGFYDLEL